MPNTETPAQHTAGVNNGSQPRRPPSSQDKTLAARTLEQAWGLLHLPPWAFHRRLPRSTGDARPRQVALRLYLSEGPQVECSRVHRRHNDWLAPHTAFWPARCRAVAHASDPVWVALCAAAEAMGCARQFTGRVFPRRRHPPTGAPSAPSRGAATRWEKRTDLHILVTAHTVSRRLEVKRCSGHSQLLCCCNCRASPRSRRA